MARAAGGFLELVLGSEKEEHIRGVGSGDPCGGLHRAEEEAADRADPHQAGANPIWEWGGLHRVPWCVPPCRCPGLRDENWGGEG
jgi:hypothetical protein